MKGNAIKEKFIGDFILRTNISKFDRPCVLAVTEILTHINRMIGAETELNYKINPLKLTKGNIIIIIPVESHTRGDNDYEKMIECRFETIKNYIKNYNWDKSPGRLLWCWRTLIMSGVDVYGMTTLEYDDMRESIDYHLGPIKKIEVHDKTLNDGTVIRNIVDPLVVDYGLYVNLSVKFSDMNYCWNGLHLYEHLMTYGWENLDERNRIDMNGVTIMHGVCHVHSILKDRKTLLTYLANYLKFHNKTRETFDHLREAIILETKRTISETNYDRSLSNFGRSDPSAFDLEYKTSVFKYYSSLPFQIILLTPERLDVTYKMTVVPIVKPVTPTFKYMPLSVLRSRPDRNYSILKLSEKNDKCAIGIDCCAKPLSEDLDLSFLNTVLNNVMMKEPDPIKLEKYLNMVALPITNVVISSLDIHRNEFSID